MNEAVSADAMENGALQREDSLASGTDDDQQDDVSLSGFGVRPEEMHVTEEWFHSKIDREVFCPSESRSLA